MQRSGQPLGNSKPTDVLDPEAPLKATLAGEVFELQNPTDADASYYMSRRQTPELDMRFAQRLLRVERSISPVQAKVIAEMFCRPTTTITRTKSTIEVGLTFLPARKTTHIFHAPNRSVKATMRECVEAAREANIPLSDWHIQTASTEVQLKQYTSALICSIGYSSIVPLSHKLAAVRAWFEEAAKIAGRA